MRRSPTTQTTWLGLTREQFVKEQRADPTWSELVEYQHGGIVPSRKIAHATLDQFEVLEEVLYYIRTSVDDSFLYTVVVPRQLFRKALEISHEQSGHLRQFKTIKKAEEMFYWQTLKIDVVKYLKECLNCQQYKHNTGLSQPYWELPVVSQPLERIAIDLTDMTSGQDGNRCILTIIDNF